MSQLATTTNDDISTNDELLGVLASLTDLSSAAFFTYRKLDCDQSLQLRQHSGVVKMYGQEFLHLSEKFRTKLLGYGEDVLWTEDSQLFLRSRNGFDVYDADSTTTLAALSAYAEQQQRFLEEVSSWNIVGVKIVERAQMLISSMQSWAQHVREPAASFASF